MTIHELFNIRLNANSVTDMLQYLKESNERAKKTGVYHRLARGDGIRYSHPFASGLGEINCRKRCVEVKGQLSEVSGLAVRDSRILLAANCFLSDCKENKCPC